MKYELTSKKKRLQGHTLHRVKYADGTLGGWVESKANLSEDGGARGGMPLNEYQQKALHAGKKNIYPSLVLAGEAD